ncbi:hypothetical protein MJG53_013061 [Ovis ammon polii x Ovis aries]|uniref:Uncharacterized protein n=2 Tax=Ovis TaxID=9935 RepID=A0A835ZPX4_SHEEP|nr:hypothetical protein JEQ12_008127 [Ovis aries]KAI4573223.1 hypothetical protein MJG53_013061 [Ovis ammon polii x Ovis aries]
MLAEGRVTLRAALWLLGLWAVLAPAQCSRDRPSWRYISTEVVIPRKELHQGKGAQGLGWLSYSLRFGDSDWRVRALVDLGKLSDICKTGHARV